LRDLSELATCTVKGFHLSLKHDLSGKSITDDTLGCRQMRFQDNSAATKQALFYSKIL